MEVEVIFHLKLVVHFRYTSKKRHWELTSSDHYTKEIIQIIPTLIQAVIDGQILLTEFFLLVKNHLWVCRFVGAKNSVMAQVVYWASVVHDFFLG